MNLFKAFLLLFYPEIKSILKKIVSLTWYLNNFYKFKKHPNDINNLKINFQLLDKNDSHLNKSGHYLLQDLFVAKKILAHNPEKHVDIGSRVDGFLTHLSIFREVEVFDIRKFPIEIPNLKYTTIDFLMLPNTFINYSPSISSLHAIEHFGLGRYGDLIDPLAHLKAIDNIWHLLQRNGIFYFSVPIGSLRIEFNAHRVFSLEYLIRILNPKFKILEFSYIDDRGILHENCILNNELISTNFGCYYGCGIFILQKEGPQN